MDYIEENTDTQSVKKFMNKFMTVYAIGIIILFPLTLFVGELVGIFLPVEYKTIGRFIFGIYGLYKINSLAIKKSLIEVNITFENCKEILKKIYTFLMAILIVNVLFSFTLFGFPALYFSDLKGLFCTSFAFQAVAIIIRYIVIMMICKSNLEKITLGKEINKLTYLLALCTAIVFISIGALMSGNKNYLIPLKTIKDVNFANQYINSEWEEILVTARSEFEFSLVEVNAELVNLEKNKIKEYEIVKVICTVYDKTNNSVIGTTEKYYKDITLKYGYFNFRRNIEVKLTDPLKIHNCKIEVKAYGVKK